MEPGTAVFAGLLVLAIVLWLVNLRATAKRAGERAEEIGGYRMPRQPGQEATDIEGFNAAMSRNAPIGAVPQEVQGMGREASTYVAPVRDDETYAGRYHAAFGKSEKKE
jgi:hypothetical protein